MSGINRERKNEIKKEINSEPTDHLKQLLNITSHKKQRLQSILNMTKMQSQAIEQNDMNLLTSCIQEKQRHIDAIDALDAQFGSIYDEDIKTRLANGSFSNRSLGEQQLYTELQTVISRVQELVKAIGELEKVNKFKAQNAMNDLKQKISHIQAGKRGYSAYNRPHAFSDGIYIDQKK